MAEIDTYKFQIYLFQLPENITKARCMSSRRAEQILVSAAGVWLARGFVWVEIEISLPSAGIPSLFSWQTLLVFVHSQQLVRMIWDSKGRAVGSCRS